MALQNGAGVATSYRVQTAHGALPTNDSTARTFPTYAGAGFTESTQIIVNPTIRPTMDRLRGRQGFVEVTGLVEGAMALGVYDPLFEAALRGTWSSPLTSGTFTASYVASTGVLTRSTGSFVGEGFKIGDVVYLAGANVTAQASIPLILTAVGTTTCTVGNNVAVPGNSFVPITDISSAASTTLVRPKKLVQATSPVLREFAFEHWEPAIPNSSRYLDNRVDAMTLTHGTNELVKVGFGFRGCQVDSQATQYFSSASTISAPPMACIDVVTVYRGATSVTLTGLELSLSLGTQVDPIIGSRFAQNVFDGIQDPSVTLRFQRDSRSNLSAFLAESGPFAMTVLYRELGSNGYHSVSIPAFTLGAARVVERIKDVGVQIEEVPLIIGVGSGSDRDAAAITMCSTAS